MVLGGITATSLTIRAAASVLEIGCGVGSFFNLKGNSESQASSSYCEGSVSPLHVSTNVTR
jgi:hypothetical protein